MTKERIAAIEDLLLSDGADAALVIADLIGTGRDLLELRDDLSNQLAEAQSALGVAQATNERMAADIAKWAKRPDFIVLQCRG